MQSYSQEVKLSKKKQFNIALEHFNNEEFDIALEKFLILDSLFGGNFEINYYIGACYLNTKYDKIKGIPYLEFALEKGESLLPKDVFRELAILYHLDYKFDKSEQLFEKYLKLADKTEDKEDIEYSKRMLEICENAKTLTKDTLQVEIENLGSPVNTSFPEHSAHISTDESIIYLTRDLLYSHDISARDSTQQILVSEKENELWGMPQEIFIEGVTGYKAASIAGISPDGSNLFVQLTFTETNSDLYTCQLINKHCKNPVKLDARINTSYHEGNASITPDGRDFYFSSDRPGGYGGMDIYKVLINENGDWGSPINLGPTVNTPYNEDSPFIHPDRQTLYFCSDGHNTIGGYDIFRTFYLFFEEDWAEPVNMGYPVNTTHDDMYFVLSADGNNGYFSSSHDNRMGFYDIYKVSLNKSIPLTMIKGTITAGVPAKPIGARIRVVDKETNQRVKYIYNPNPENGKYLMIFPPGKNYDMIIEANGYLPHLLNIYIPNQNYFYELFQEIHLSPMKVNVNGDIIGEEITVKNTFYDIIKTLAPDSVYKIKDSIRTEKYTKLLEIIEEMIETTDSIGLEKLDNYSQQLINDSIDHNDIIKCKDYTALLNLIENAINNTDSLALNLLNLNTIYDEITTEEYFYHMDGDTAYLIMTVIGKDTLWTLPGLNTRHTVTDENIYKLTIRNDTIIDNTLLKENNLNNIEPVRTELLIYFDLNSSNIKPAYSNELEKMVQTMMTDNGYTLSIKGYADFRGEDSYNLLLSERRAEAVKQYFTAHGVKKTRIVAKGLGEIASSDVTNENELGKNRRVELQIFKETE